MKNLESILLDITRLTSNIETNYPEIYKYLDENPSTISLDSNPVINADVMNDYLESLKQLVEQYITTHKHKKT